MILGLALPEEFVSVSNRRAKGHGSKISHIFGFGLWHRFQLQEKMLQRSVRAQGPISRACCACCACGVWWSMLRISFFDFFKMLIFASIYFPEKLLMHEVKCCGAYVNLFLLEPGETFKIMLFWTWVSFFFFFNGHRNRFCSIILICWKGANSKLFRCDRRGLLKLF